MKNHKTAFLNAAFIASLSFSGLAFGQDSPAFVTVADGGSETSSAVVVSVAKPTATDQKPLTERWLDLDTLSWAGRYRSSVNTNGRHMFDFGQDRYIASGKVKLDEQGKYTINFHASSGRYFNWAYADEVGGRLCAGGDRDPSLSLSGVRGGGDGSVGGRSGRRDL
jgi:hypothetical protein